MKDVIITVVASSIKVLVNSMLRSYFALESAPELVPAGSIFWSQQKTDEKYKTEIKLCPSYQLPHLESTCQKGKEKRRRKSQEEEEKSKKREKFSCHCHNFLGFPPVEVACIETVPAPTCHIPLLIHHPHI